MFVGFAAIGTLARRIIDGAKQVRIFGEEIPVKADIYTIGGDPVAVGLPIEGVRAGRLIIADAGAGRLVLVGQQSWEPSAPTTVWQVEVPEVGTTQ